MDELIEAFDLQSGSTLLSLVGAGGKTTTLFKLAKALASSGKSVLITTTTAIFLPHSNQYDLIEINDSPKLEFAAPGSVVVTGRSVSSAGKLMGLSPEWVDGLHLKSKFDCILVEADGAKQKPIKAPDGHEPVVPQLTTHLLGVIGLDAIGEPADQKSVHRLERFCDVTKLIPNQVIDALAVCRLIRSERGLFKGAPATAAKYLVLNKAERTEDLHKARTVIRILQLQENEGIRCRTSSMQSGKVWPNPLSEISGVIMAAGFARRMNAQKLLLPVNGLPVLERVLRAALKSRLQEVLIVYSEDSVKALAAKYPVKLIYNPSASIGQSESVKLGASNSHKASKGVMFLPGDQPFLSQEVVDGMIEVFEMNGLQHIVVPKYQEERGTPVLFPCRLKEALTGIQGDTGGREVIRQNQHLVVEYRVEDKRAGFDIDTREDYEQAEKMAEKNEQESARTNYFPNGHTG